MTYEKALKEYLHQCEECKAFVKMNCDACRAKMAIKALQEKAGKEKKIKKAVERAKAWGEQE